jgi:hypothetical protein
MSISATDEQIPTPICGLPPPPAHGGCGGAASHAAVRLVAKWVCKKSSTETYFNLLFKITSTVFIFYHLLGRGPEMV